MAPKIKSQRVVLFVANYSFTLINFRKNLIKALQKDYVVYAICSDDAYSDALQKMGVKLLLVNFNGRHKNPFAELACFLKILWHVILIRPVAVLSFTIKANLYCGLARYVSKFHFFPNVTGLGSFTSQQGILSFLYNSLYRIFLNKCTAVFVQNVDNFNYIKNLTICNDNQIILLPGSGVDLKKFKFYPYKFSHLPRKFYFISRIMKEKGVIEFLQAAQMFYEGGGLAEFYLVGNVLSEFSAEFEQKLKGTRATYLGESNDIRSQIENCDVLVLPSYYNEGTPKILIEAAAMGRAIITSDMPGCRDLISNNNGYKVRIKDPHDLLEKFSLFASLTDMKVQEMGKNSRILAETNFSEELVIKSYLNAFNSAINTLNCN